MRFLLFFLLAPLCISQTFTVGVPLIDLSKSTQVIPFPFGGTLPTTGCVPNSFFNKTGASAGLYLNTGTGTCAWAIVTGGGGGSTVTCAISGGVTCVFGGGGAVQLSADPAVVAFKDAASGGLQSGTSPVHCGSASGSSTIYTASCSPTLSAYSANQTLWLNCTTTSGGVATLNIDGLGAKPFKQFDGTVMGSAFVCPRQYPIWYDGTNFYAMTVGLGGGGSVSSSIITNAFVPGGGYQVPASSTVYLSPGAGGGGYANGAISVVAVPIRANHTVQNLCITTFSTQPGTGSLIAQVIKTNAGSPTVLLTATVIAGGSSTITSPVCSAGTGALISGDAIYVGLINNASSASDYPLTVSFEMQ